MQKEDSYHIRKVQEVIIYIEEHLNEHLDLNTIAGKACLSPYHFHRIFKKYQNENLYSFIQRKRVEKALELIRNHKDLYLYEIAIDCGFSTQALFIKAFKRYYGTTPHEFRKEISMDNQIVNKNKKKIWTKI